MCFMNDSIGFFCYIIKVNWFLKYFYCFFLFYIRIYKNINMFYMLCIIVFEFVKYNLNSKINNCLKMNFRELIMFKCK